jgi:hypothetical protein
VKYLLVCMALVALSILFLAWDVSTAHADCPACKSGVCPLTEAHPVVSAVGSVLARPVQWVRRLCHRAVGGYAECAASQGATPEKWPWSPTPVPPACGPTVPTCGPVTPYTTHRRVFRRLRWSCCG